MDKNIFANISPLDHRYYVSNQEIFDRLSLFLSENATIKYCTKVEIALLKTHLAFSGKDSPELNDAVDSAEKSVTPEEVYQEEQKTQHNIRALVNCLKRYIPEKVGHFVHLGATSVDILDTAMAMRVRDSMRDVILPLAIDVENLLIEIAAREADTPQIGRTHGQHAVPLTFGFALSEYVARLGKSILYMDDHIQNLRGKLAGAVGAYNSISIIVKDPVTFEEAFLKRLGLKPSEISTQIVEPEYLLRLLLEINIAFGVLANLADDLRNLQRSEINELRESFKKDQVGSSTMPQKRNPWNSEHVKSLWKAFAPRVMTFYMDQISEHQRDLTNSASSRFIFEYLAGFTAALARMKKILTSLTVNREVMYKNLKMSGDLSLAEAAYILLSLEGESEGHEILRKITIESEKTGKPISELLKENKKLWKDIGLRLKSVTGLKPEEFFNNPAMYRGQAKEKTLVICGKYSTAMKDLLMEKR